MLGYTPHFHELAHFDLLPTGTYAGKVLVWRNHTEDISPVWIFDGNTPQNLTQLPGPQTPLDPCLGSNLICSGHVKLEDGSILIGGGTDIPLSPTGLASSWRFLPNGTWQFVGCMNRARFYPTLLRFGANRTISFGGWEVLDVYHPNYEIYNPPMGNWVLSPDAPLHVQDCFPFGGGPFFLYPWVHLFSSGFF
jgi:hypothetical protein